MVVRGNTKSYAKRSGGRLMISNVTACTLRRSDGGRKPILFGAGKEKLEARGRQGTTGSGGGKGTGHARPRSGHEQRAGSGGERPEQELRSLLASSIMVSGLVKKGAGRRQIRGA